MTARAWKRRVKGFLAVIFLLALLWRWPTLIHPDELNVDESTAITLALRYLQDPVPWRSADGMTCGPLTTWIHLWPVLFGGEPTYFTLRLTTLGLILVIVAAMVFALGEVVGRKHALIATLPLAILLATSSHRDFLTSALEYLPVALMALGIALFLRWQRKQGTGLLYLFGLITGALPFTKLQSAPSALFLFGVALGFVLVARSSRPRVSKEVLFLVLGALTFPTLILVPVLAAGAGPEFVHFYLAFGASYRMPGSPMPVLEFLVHGNLEFGIFAVGSWMVVVLLLKLLSRGEDQTGWWAGFCLIAGFGGVLLASVLKSGFSFPHYLLLLILPASLLPAWVWKGAMEASSCSSDSVHRVAPLLVSALALAQIVSKVALPTTADALREAALAHPDPVAVALRAHASPGQTLVVWGWVNRWHVTTGLRPATRFPCAISLADPSPRSDAHRRVFLADLERERPRLFVDAVDEFRWPTWSPGIQARHENFPDLANWIRNHYDLAATVDLGPGKQPARIFTRRSP